MRIVFAGDVGDDARRIVGLFVRQHSGSTGIRPLSAPKESWHHSPSKDLGPRRQPKGDGTQWKPQDAARAARPRSDRYGYASSGPFGVAALLLTSSKELAEFRSRRLRTRAAAPGRSKSQNWDPGCLFCGRIGKAGPAAALKGERGARNPAGGKRRCRGSVPTGRETSSGESKPLRGR